MTFGYISAQSSETLPKSLNLFQSKSSDRWKISHISNVLCKSKYNLVSAVSSAVELSTSTAAASVFLLLFW